MVTRGVTKGQKFEFKSSSPFAINRSRRKIPRGVCLCVVCAYVCALVYSYDYDTTAVVVLSRADRDVIRGRVCCVGCMTGRNTVQYTPLRVFLFFHLNYTYNNYTDTVEGQCYSNKHVCEPLIDLSVVDLSSLPQNKNKIK